MTAALIIFIAVYVGIVVFRRQKEIVLWAGIIVALVFLKFGLPDLVHGIYWNILGIFFGSLILAELFIVSRIPETVSDYLINKSPNIALAFMSVIAFTSFLSTFIENIATVLIVAPIALELSRKAKVSPVPVMIGLAVSSNLQGTATLIGDPPSMILAAEMKMNFIDFFIYRGAPSIFFFVEIGAVVGFFVIFVFLRKMKAKVEKVEMTRPRSLVPLFLFIGMVFLLSVASFIDPDSKWFGGTVCMFLGIGGMFWLGRFDRPEFDRVWRRFDWRTLIFLAGVFALVAMLVDQGVISELAEKLQLVKGANTFILLSMVVWFSVLFSAFIDNVPYITVMLPIVQSFASGDVRLQTILVFGLLIGSCLGGNITPIGASANIVAMGLLRREGYDISFPTFMKIGIPFTIAATAASYIALYLVYGA